MYLLSTLFSHIRVLGCCRILHQQTLQSSNGVVANLEARAEDEDAEDEVQPEDHTAEEDADEEEQDESEDDVCIPLLHANVDSDSYLKGCRNYNGASSTLFGLPVSLLHSG